MSSSTHDGPKLNVDDLLFFPGKELNDTNIAGRRSPPQPIRLAIGRHGVYKFERDKDKVLAFWGFQELSDWSFSGYSFTLNFINRKVYHLRTDDGQAISHWIDSFSKNPDQASIAAKQFRSLGTNTMRKFSAELKPISYQAKFYTLNPRRSKPQSIDPARMLSAYGVKTLPQTQRQKSPLKSAENDKLHWSNTSIGPPEATKLKESSGSSSEGYLTASLELGETESATGLIHDSVSALRAQSMDSLFNGTSSQSANHSPPEEAPPITVPPESGRDIKPPAIIRKGEEDEAPPIVPPRSGSLPITLGHEYSTLEESPPTVLIKVSDEELSKKPNVRVPRPHMYESIEIFPQKSPPSSPGLPMRQETRGDRLAVREGSAEGEYDHLSPTKKTHKSPIRRKKDANKETCISDDVVVHSPLRRNESLPPMVFHSPVVRRRKTDDEEDEDEQSLSDNTEDEEAPSPQPPIVFRSKKDSNSSDDPLADFLSVRTNLRWSQNLNPIYDNIKGMKISPAVAYEASSLLAKQDQAIPEEGDHTPCPSGRTTEERESVSSDRRSSSGSAVETLVLVPDVPHCLTLPKRRPHNYEEVTIGPSSFGTEDRPRFGSKNSRPLSDHYQSLKEVSPGISDPSKYDDKSLTLSSPVRRLKSADTSQFISPRLNKRVITRRSKTVRSNDDFNAPHGRQHAQKVADTMKDFSFTNREYRVFFVKLPNGQLVSEVVNINRPVSILINKLTEQLGVTSSDIEDKWSMYVEGSILTTMKEAVLEFGEVQPAKAHVDRSVSLTQLVDSNSLADQGAAPILLKNSLSFRMQGITTSRILRLDDGDDSFANYCSVPITNEFHKKWLGVVQGNQPCTLESAVKLAAIQYQAYFLDRTAENSVVGFCRPNDFLPAEFAGVRGIEQKMYKEQEKIKSKNQGDIQKFYIKYCCSLPANETMFFPVREPRRKLFQSTRLKPVLLGVNKNGILRVCPKTKEVLDTWEYQVLKNWAYSRRTFVIAFNDKSYAVESNQARWISELVDFFVDSIVQSSPPPQTPTSTS